MSKKKDDIINNIPKGWTSYKLGDVITLVNGRAYGKSELLVDGKYKVIRIQNLNGGESWYYSNLELDENKYCYKGDLLFAWSTTFRPYYWNSEKAIFHYHIWNLIFSDKIDKRFAYYYLLEITEELKKSSHGVAMLHITKSGMEGWHLPLPSFEEQKFIAAQLDNLFARIDKAIELVQENLEHINHLVPAALNDVLEEAYEEVLLTEVCTFNPIKSEVKSLGDVQVSFVPMADLMAKRMYFEPKQTKQLNEVYTGYTYFKEDDVLLAKVTPCFENGKSGIAKGIVNRVGFGSSEYYVFRASNKILPEWIYYNISSNDFLSEGAKNMSGAVGLKRVTKDFINNWKIKLPEVSKQIEIVKYLNSLAEQQQQLQQQYTKKLQQLKSLKASLLDAAFRGELTKQATKAKVIKLQPKIISLVAESNPVYQKSVPLNIPEEKRPAARVVLAAKIISLHQADENWTRIKFQKLLYLAEHIIKADWKMKYFIQTAGPLDNHFLYDELQPALKKKKWFQEVDYRYYPLAKAEGVEKEYNQYFEPVDNRLSKLFKSFLKATEAQSEIAATLYAVWNNLLIKQEPVLDERIIEGFYKWSERKEQYKQEQLISALKWMRENDLVPEGFGKEIKKAKK